jgi:hypothetical protein
MKLLCPVLAVLVCSSVAANAQTVADQARKERAKKQVTATIVIDNDTIKNTTGTITTGTPAPQAATPEAPQTPAPAAQHDEKWWHEQFEKVRAAIKKLDADIALLEGNVKEANRDFLTRAYDPTGAGQKNVTETQAKLDAAKAERTRQQANLAKLEEDLRKSGQPAGWAR